MNKLTVIIASGLIAISTVSEGRNTIPEHVIAKTLYAEGRSEGTFGLDMIASVIYNRGLGQFNKAIIECLRHKQFSCWNGKTDIIVSVKEVVFKPDAVWTDEQAWAYCKKLEREMYDGTFKSLGSWTHYARIDCKAKWLNSMTNVRKCRQHIFGTLPYW